MLSNRHLDRAARRSRTLRVEPLENRFLLSVPAVTNVTIGSTQWTSGFVNYLESAGYGTDGYSIPVGSCEQLNTLPWTNIDQIRITFTVDVVVAAADLSVSGVNTAARAFSGFTYDSHTFTAVWTLSAPITKDKLMLDLDADGLAPVRSVDTADALAGAWTNCQSTYPSAGNSGQDFQFRFNVLPGDADGNNSVALADATLVRSKIGKNAGDVGYNLRYDVDGSGGITWDDYNAVRARLADVLPSGNPVGMTDDAPTTSGIPNVAVNENAADEVLSLADYFADDEDPGNMLAYQIVDNTNSALFDSLDIDSYGGLTLDFAQDAHGDATLTIRAIDSAGLLVDTTLAVHVNDAPVITSFQVIQASLDTWTLQGTVTDSDNLVEGMVVTFGGVFESYHVTATVQADGTFSLTQQFVGLTAGEATALTRDPYQALSNVATDFVTTG